MDEYLWSKHTSQQLEAIIEQENPVVILPTGAVEQHGPNLPVDTDAHISEHLSRQTAKNTDVRTLVLPPVWAGISAHHMDFSGTITVSQQTFHSYVYDVVVSLDEHGVEHILILNGHGGNTAQLQSTIDELGAREEIYPYLIQYWDLLADFIDQIRDSEPGGMAHGGELETSIKMEIAPSDVGEDRIDVFPEGPLGTTIDMYVSNPLRFYRPIRHYSETGQMGAASLASREKGQELIESLVNELVRTVSKIARTDDSDPKGG